jgi:uncharacterized protein YukE
VSWYGDPDALDALARQLAGDADAVRARGRALEDSVRGMRWQGDAATAFRHVVSEDADHLHRAARELDEAAAALRAHAAEVRAKLARIRALERAVAGLFDEQLRSLQAAAQALADAVTDPLATVRRVVADPPWAGWAWRPGTLPAPGDKAWLDVGDYLAGRGVRL